MDDVERDIALRAEEFLRVDIGCPSVQSNFVDAF
jgi:hypothetical protein